MRRIDIIVHATTLRSIVLALLLLPLLSLPARAADTAQTYAVLSFEVNGPDKYSYLGRGFQDMLISRLHRKDKFIPVPRETVRSVATPSSAQDAEALRTKLDSDYLVWGVLTMLGKQASLDVQVKQEGKDSWFVSESSPMSDLIPTLEKVSDNINADIFNRPDFMGSAAQAKKAKDAEPSAKLNPGLVNKKNTGSIRMRGEYSLWYTQ